MLNKRVLIPVVLALAAAAGAFLTQGGQSPCAPLTLAVISGWLVCIAAKALSPWAGMLVSAVTGLSVSLYLGVDKKGLASSFCSVPSHGLLN